MDGEASIGRVRRHEYGFKPPEWHWSMYADAPGTIPRSFAFHGKVDTKEKAKAAVEEAYAHFVAATPDARAYYQKAAREMRERAALCGGQLSTDCQDGIFTVQATLPLARVRTGAR